MTLLHKVAKSLPGTTIDDVFLWQLFPDGLQDDFQLNLVVLGFGWSLW